MHKSFSSPGRVCRDIGLSMDLLIVHEGMSTVSLYDARATLLRLAFNKELRLVPEDLASALVTVQGCSGFSLQLGGFPYLFLIAMMDGHHLVRRVEDDAVIGVIKTDSSSMETDSVFFSEDESGNIIQKGEHSVRLFQASCDKDEVSCPNKYKMRTMEPVKVVDFSFQEQRTQPCTSRYGRTITRRDLGNSCHTGAFPTLISDLDLEDELDLVYVLSCDHQSVPPTVHLNVLKSNTLEVVKSQVLDFTFPARLRTADVDYEKLFPCTVAADRDLLIVSWKELAKHRLVVYQLHSRDAAVPKPVKMEIM